MTNYKMQYWLYAILNKLHGNAVKFTRDPLHGLYSVNRHGFTVSTALPLHQVRDSLAAILFAAGYHEVVDEFKSSDRMTVRKVVGNEDRFVTINYQGYVFSKKVDLFVVGRIYRISR